MNRDPRADPRLNPHTIRRIDALCTEFEASWRAGERAAIEQFLHHDEGFERSVLLRELLALELDASARTRVNGPSRRNTFGDSLATATLSISSFKRRQPNHRVRRGRSAPTRFPACTITLWTRDFPVAFTTMNF